MRPVHNLLARSLNGKPVLSWSTAQRGKGRAGPRHRPAGDAKLMGSRQRRRQKGSHRGGQGTGNSLATESPPPKPCLCFLFFFCEGFMSSSVGSFRISDSFTANWKTWKRNPIGP